LLDSPLLPTDHRDSPRTITMPFKPVNTLTTRCREALEALSDTKHTILGLRSDEALNLVVKLDSPEH
jgi:hypothetical protein